jgi:hypothetical protein
MRTLNVTYPVFSQTVGTKKVYYHVKPDNRGYVAMFSLGEHLCVSDVHSEHIPHFEANYKPNATEAGSEDDAKLLSTLARFDVDGNPKITPEPPIGDKRNFMSVNWCDKCSWYEGSVQVTNETLTDTGNGLTFASAHDRWIDMKHGRVTFEDQILADNPGKWVAVITVNGAQKTESSPGTTNGDYQIDYENGTVTFNSSQAGNTVAASYWYANAGTYTVKPNPGKKIKLQRVEVQFSMDIQLLDTMQFMPYGYAGVFAPQYVQLGVFQPTQLIPLMALPYRYKTRNDYVNESCGNYPIIPPFGGNGWRGGQQEIITLPWIYLTKTELFSSYGMEIRISMENNIEMGGEMATATFYTVETDE